MLKIRIAGTEEELKRVAGRVPQATIQKYRLPNGKLSFAIDVLISVDDFLENIDLTDPDNQDNQFDDVSEERQTLTAELEELLEMFEETATE